MSWMFAVGWPCAFTVLVAHVLGVTLGGNVTYNATHLQRLGVHGTATWAPAGPRTGARGVMDAIISLRTATRAIVCHLQVHIWWHHHPPFNSLTFRTN